MFRSRKPKQNSGFLISLVFNLILNIEMGIVAVALLVLHFTFGLPLVFFFIALALWILPTLVMTCFLFFVSGMSGETEYRENKNPYSVGSGSVCEPENKNPYSKK